MLEAVVMTNFSCVKDEITIKANEGSSFHFLYHLHSTKKTSDHWQQFSCSATLLGGIKGEPFNPRYSKVEQSQCLSTFAQLRLARDNRA